MEIQSLDRGDHAREKADGQAQSPGRVKDVEPQANMLDRDGEVDGPFPSKDLNLPGCQQFPDERVHLGMAPLDGAVLLDLPVFPKHHRVGARNVDIRNPFTDGRSNDAAELSHFVSPLTGVLCRGTNPRLFREKRPPPGYRFFSAFSRAVEISP